MVPFNKIICNLKLKYPNYYYSSYNYPVVTIVSEILTLPHGSEKSPEKNRNEIRHSLCMPHGRVKIVANYEENDT